MDSPRRKVRNRLSEQFLGHASARAFPVCPFCLRARDCDVQLRIALLKRGDFVRENEISRRAAGVNKEDVSGPGSLREIASDAHHRRDPHASGDENDALRLGSIKREFSDRASRFDQVAHFEQVNNVAGNRAARLTLDG